MTSERSAALAEAAHDLVRCLVTFARTQQWTPSARDVLDLLWTTATTLETPRFAVAAGPPAPPVEPPPEPEADDRSGMEKIKDERPPGAAPRQASGFAEVRPIRPGVHVPSQPGAVVRLPAPPPLENERLLLQALRPLLVRGPSRRRQTLDLQATIQRITDERIWELIEQPLLERQLELVLILDATPSLMMWRSRLAQLARSLQSCGAFREVTIACLVAPQGVPQLVKPREVNKAGPARARSRLLGTRPPTLYLVATDCVSTPWHSRDWLDLLDAWSRQATVAILQVLPEHLWSRTALARGNKLRATVGSWLAPNRNFRVREQSFDELDLLIEKKTGTAGPTHAAALLPSAALFDLASVRRMARFLAARSRVPAVCYRLRRDSADPSAEPRPPLDALEVFRLRASEPARRLATLLAASPAISLPLTRILERNYLPEESGPLIEAEIWLAGLLMTLEESASPDPEETLYTFRPGIRDLLLDGVPRSLSRQILKRTSAYLEKHLGRLGGFRALLTAPRRHQGALAAGPGTDPIACIAAEILSRLGGDLARLVDATAVEPLATDELPRPSNLVGLVTNTVLHRFAWSPDGTILAIPTLGGSLYLFNVKRGNPPIQVSQAGLNQAVWTPDGQWLALACFNRKARVYQRDLSKFHRLMDHNSDVTSVAFSPDGTLLATGTAGGTVRLWTTDRWDLRGAHGPEERDRPEYGGVRALCWLNEQTIAAGYAGRTLIVQRYAFLNLRRLAAARELAAGGSSLVLIPPTTSSWLPAVPVLALGQTNGEIQLWKTTTWEEITRIFPHRGRVTGLSVSHDARLLASKARDGTIAVTSIVSGRILARMTTTPTESPYGMVAFQPGSHVLAVALAEDKELRFYDLAHLVETPPEVLANPLRVRFVGSLPKQLTNQEEFFATCRQCGYRLALSGHSLLISSAKHDVIDPHVFAGYVQARRPGKVVFDRPGDAPHKEYVARLQRQLAPGAGQFQPGVTLECIRYDGNRWTEAFRLETIRITDILVVIGGGPMTLTTCVLAERQGIPVIAVPHFGGTAEALWSHASRNLQRFGVSSETLASFRQPQDPVQLGQRLLDLVTETADLTRALRSHPYFDAGHYPWNKPDAAALYQGLTGTYTISSYVMRLYNQCGTGLPPLNRNQGLGGIWQQALENLTRAGRLERLCQLILQDGTARAIHPIVRRIQDARQRATLSVSPPFIKVLFLTADPRNSNLTLDEEGHAIDGVLDGSSLDFVQHGAIRRLDLPRYLLKYRPHILHFAGSATEDGSLRLVGASRAPDTVSPSELLVILKTHQGNIRLIVLNTCYSAPVAKALAEEFDCAIGMAGELTNTNAIAFAVAFYEALRSGSSVQVAFEIGKANLTDVRARDRARIYGRSGIDLLTLVLAPR